MPQLHNRLLPTQDTKSWQHLQQIFSHTRHKFQLSYTEGANEMSVASVDCLSSGLDEEVTCQKFGLSNLIFARILVHHLALMEQSSIEPSLIFSFSSSFCPFLSSSESGNYIFPPGQCCRLLIPFLSFRQGWLTFCLLGLWREGCVLQDPCGAPKIPQWAAWQSRQ